MTFAFRQSLPPLHLFYLLPAVAVATRRSQATVRSIVYSPRRCIRVLRRLLHDFAVSIILAVRKQLREVYLSSYTPRRCNEIRRVREIILPIVIL
ncbi:hypothetical protein B0H34DRAFT_734404 [Crassisporium funariophilum]|nr:hypothetical protein B0H34DRAFT_734404 [Crassisporium funariophilum]